METPFALPRTPIEKYLVQVWAQLLDVDLVGIHDGFLELGGDSLLASRLIGRVKDMFQVQLPIGSLFDAPTVAELAVEIEWLPITRRKKSTAFCRRSMFA